MSQKVTLFSDYFSKQPVQVSLDDVVNIIATNATLKSNTEAYRSSGSKTFKLHCPLFAPSCLFEGGKAAEHITGLTGLSLVDLDHVPSERLPEVRRVAQADPHTLLCYTTVSGQGVRIIFAYEMPPELTPVQQRAYYSKAFRAGNEYYGQVTGQEPDLQCKNVGRLSGLAHDPQAYYAPGAKVFTADWITARTEDRKDRQKAAARQTTEVRKIRTTYQDILAAELEGEGKTYREGSRNQYVSCLAYKLNELGFSAEAALAFLHDRFPDCENTEGVVRSCYRDTDRHGTRKPAKGTASRAACASVEDIKEYLGTHVRLRFNEVSRRLEYSFNMEEGGADDFLPMDNRTANSLWVDLAREKNIAGQTLERVLESDYAPRFNPFREYMEGLAKWHAGDTDHILQFARTVRVKGDEGEQELWHRHLTKWLVGMVAGWLRDDVVNNVILVLIGEQGIYKTTWFQYLLPPVLRRYFYTKTDAGRLTKDDLMVLSQYGLVVYEELDTMKAADLNQLKAAVTMTSIDERAPYARFVESRPHIASLGATGNNPQFLSDPTGNRRWLPFEVESIQSPRDCPPDYEGIFSQAYFLYKSGFRYWFSKEEVAEQNRHNSEFETPRLEHELVNLYFARPLEGEAGVFMTASRALQIISGNLSAKLSAVYIGRAFTELGFRKVRSHTGYGYLARERTAEEIRMLQHKMAMECV